MGERQAAGRFVPFCSGTTSHSGNEVLEPPVPTGVRRAVADGRRRIGRRSGPVHVGATGLRGVVADCARARAVGLPAAVLLLLQLPPSAGDRHPVRGRPTGRRRGPGGRVGARCPSATPARPGVHAGVPRPQPGGRRTGHEPGGDAGRRRGERPVHKQHGGTDRLRGGERGAARKRSGEHGPSGRDKTRVGRAAKAVQDRGHAGCAREQTGQNGLLINALLLT